MQKLELKALLPPSSLHHCPQYDPPLQEYNYCKNDLADVQRRKCWWRESWKYLHISAQSQMQILHLGMQIPGCRPEFFTFKCKYSCAGGHTAQFTGQREISFSANARRAVVSFPDPLPFESEAENLSRRAVHPQTHFSFCTSWRKTVEHEFCMILAPRNRNFPCWNQKQ